MTLVAKIRDFGVNIIDKYYQENLNDLSLNEAISVILSTDFKKSQCVLPFFQPDINTTDTVLNGPVVLQVIHHEMVSFLTNIYLTS